MQSHAAEKQVQMEFRGTGIGWLIVKIPSVTETSFHSQAAQSTLFM